MNKISSLLSLLIVVFASASSQAAIYGLDSYLPNLLTTYTAAIDRDSPSQGQRSCESMYAPFLQDGVLDIRYALGYFDDTRGKEVIENGVNYGLSPSMDIEVFHALRGSLKKICPNRHRRLCEFRESGDPKSGKVTLQRKLKIHGQKVLVRITLTHASASESYVRNKSSLLQLQQFLTQQSEDNYFGGLKTADVVFYNGHSRNGGGPDFNPPVLTSSKKINYNGYYLVHRTGIKKTLAAARQNPNPGFILGFFSCYAKRHFKESLLRNNPSQKMILSSDTIDYYDSLEGSVGYMEALLRGTCGSELSYTAKKDQSVRQGFQDFQFN